MKIYIPTRGRADIKKQQTLAMFPMATIVCPEEEADYFRKYADVLVYTGQPGLSPTRQWIMDQCTDDIMVQIDDDLTMFERFPGSTGLRKMKSCEQLLQWIENSMYFHGGVSARTGNNHVDVAYKLNTRVNCFMWFKRPVFDQFRFDGIPCMQDFWATLQLLTSGWDNSVAYKWAFNQRSSGESGGCSLYRTKEMQALAASILHDRFPDFVKVVTKNTKGKGAYDGTRTDVRIQWRKARSSFLCEDRAH